jgi:drug/metabolite transporter (DMT)-like permease
MEHEEGIDLIKQQTSAHLVALFTVLVWGTTFIATKVLLNDFSPVEILVYRFLIGYVAMLLCKPRILPFRNVKEELLYAGAGASGLVLYYLLENVALTYTLAANVSVIVSVAPLFTALFSRLVWREERFHLNFLLGFLLAFFGIAWISFSGRGVSLNPVGDLLCVLAGVAWGIYSVLCRKISDLGHPTILTTRRTFFYAILLMIPCGWLMDFRWGLERFQNWENVGNYLFLGLLASAVCFITWNWSVGVLGAVRVSVYIYLIPVVTVITAVVVLQEPVSLSTVGGTLLALAGLVLSEWKPKQQKERELML